jgi:aerobic carbon-monoxide dehydrogenase small subunit
MNISMRVNGEPQQHDVEARTLLVYYLRDVVGLTGTNIGCDTSSCGACTILMSGESVKSCTVLAVQADGADITTIEGLATGDQLHPMQESFREHHGLQCGYCTPGFVMATRAALNKKPDASPDEIKHLLGGNICRCGTYHGILHCAMEIAKKGGV